MEKAETIVFDVWDVLLCAGLDEAQTIALFECEAIYPGIFEYGVRKAAENTDLKNLPDLYSVVGNFALDNEAVHRLWNDLERKGKRVYCRNNSHYDDGFVQSVLKACGYREIFIRVIGMTPFAS